MRSILVVCLLAWLPAPCIGAVATQDPMERAIVEHVRRQLEVSSSSASSASDASATASDPHPHQDARALGAQNRGRRSRRHSMMLRGADLLLNPSNTASSSTSSSKSSNHMPTPDDFDLGFDLDDLSPMSSDASVPLPSPPKPPKEMQLGCAWSAAVTAGTFNVAFPDLNAVYQVLLYWGVTGKTTLRIEGSFPRARYFSYQSYDLASGEPLASLVDYEIAPQTGINPFQQVPAAEEGMEGTAGGRPHGTYRIHLSDTGTKGMANELAATTAANYPHRRPHHCTSKSCLALVILRLYTADPEENAFYHRNRRHHHHIETEGEEEARLWGYVPPPAVSVRYGAWANDWTGRTAERYKQLERCDPKKTNLVRSFLDWKIPQLEGDWQEGPASRLDNEDDNFVVFTPGSSHRALFANADANYLFATAKNNRTLHAWDGLQRKQLVARITGHLPTVAHGFTRWPRIAEQEDYEARYVSLSTIALKGAGPVIDTVMDVAMEHKLGGGGGDEDGRGGRVFSVVAAPERTFLDSCPPRVYQRERDLFLTTVERGHTRPPAHLAFLYRQILSQWQTCGAQDRSIARAKHICMGHHDTGLCQLRSFFVDLMGPQYPSIKYFYCWRNETWGCSCEDSAGQPVPWELERGTDEDEDEDDGDEDEDEEFFHPRHKHHHLHGRHWDDEEDEEDDYRDFVSTMRAATTTGTGTNATTLVSLLNATAGPLGNSSSSSLAGNATQATNNNRTTGHVLRMNFSQLALKPRAPRVNLSEVSSPVVTVNRTRVVDMPPSAFPQPVVAAADKEEV